MRDAIFEWQEVLGPNNILTERKDIELYETATFATNRTVIAVLKPSKRSDVAACVKIANEYAIPLYPVSKGKNWGYGSSVPSADRCVVISLEHLDNIIDFDEELAYITVEPGVSFGQVYEFLNQYGSKLIPPAIGSTPEASLIGNALERGIGKGAYGDRFLHSCNMEIVLPNGETIETGFGHFKNAKTKCLSRWGVGPNIDGLFSQSNFGIVTKMTFWLDVQPNYFQTFFYLIKDDKKLPQLVDALRQLRLEGTLTTTSTLSNDHRLISMTSQYPWQQFSNGGPLSQKYLKMKKKAFAGARWFGDDAILSPTKLQGVAAKRRVQEVLGKVVDQLIFVDSRRAKLFDLLYKPVKWATGIDIRNLSYLYNNSLYLGVPGIKQFAMCYWRKKFVPPKDINLDRDKCGIMWCSPSVPFVGNDIVKALNILESGYKKHNFEPNIGLNFLSNRSIAFTSAIVYDREVAGEDERAMACYQEIMDKLMERGYVPYRLGVQSMSNVLTESDSYNSFIQSLKQSIDPNNIIAPRHYGANAPTKVPLTVVDSLNTENVVPFRGKKRA